MQIYKIVTRAQWQAAEDQGVFLGAPIDIQDGYIHFSSSAQVVETAAKHFASQTDLLLVAVDAEKLNGDLKWEPSRGGDLFPHLYAPLQISQIVSVREIAVDSQGNHQFSGMLAQ